MNEGYSDLEIEGDMFFKSTTILIFFKEEGVILLITRGLYHLKLVYLIFNTCILVTWIKTKNLFQSFLLTTRLNEKKKIVMMYNVYLAKFCFSGT